MEERSVSLAIPGFLTLRYAVAGQHARVVLQAIRGEFADQIRGESWPAPEVGLDSIDVTMPKLVISGRTISLSIHGLGATTYRDRESWLLYGGLIAAAGPEDDGALDEMAAAYVAHQRPVWSARTGAPITAIDRDPEITWTSQGLRAALAAFTKRSVAKVRPE